MAWLPHRLYRFARGISILLSALYIPYMINNAPTSVKIRQGLAQHERGEQHAG